MGRPRPVELFALGQYAVGIGGDPRLIGPCRFKRSVGRHTCILEIV